MRQFIICACLLQAALAAPQFVTFKDGKFGVNFGGYHAEAGLGGLLTGNSAHGGLSASAGTPHGQNAAAGLNGRVAGRAAGVAYAGAQAIPSVGASAILGGSTDGHGYAASESHGLHGKHYTKTHQIEAGPVTSGPALIQPEVNYEPPRVNVIQKVHPSYKKHTLIKSTQPIAATDSDVVYKKHVVKTVHRVPTVSSDVAHTSGAGVAVSGGIDGGVGGGHGGGVDGGHGGAVGGGLGGGVGGGFGGGVGGGGGGGVSINAAGGSNVVHHALNIPIGILRSLQESLSGLRFDSHASFQKAKYIQ